MYHTKSTCGFKITHTLSDRQKEISAGGMCVRVCNITKLTGSAEPHTLKGTHIPMEILPHNEAIVRCFLKATQKFRTFQEIRCYTYI